MSTSLLSLSTSSLLPVLHTRAATIYHLSGLSCSKTSILGVLTGIVSCLKILSRLLDLQADCLLSRMARM
jgi:hypothetical protein